MKKADLFVALPIRRYKEPEFEESLDYLFAENPYYEVKPWNYYIRRNSPNIYSQRHETAKKFLSTKCSHYLYLDSDQILYDNTIELLVRAEEDIISPIIVRKVFPHVPACMSYDRKKRIDAGILSGQYEDDFRQYKDDVIEVYYSCGGLCLIKRRVFEKLEEAGIKPFYPEFTPGGDLIGTDYSFYTQAKSQGFKCHIHRAARCGHLGWFSYEVEDYYNLLDKGLSTEQGNYIMKGASNETGKN